MSKPSRRAFGQELDAILGMEQGNNASAQSPEGMDHAVKTVMVQQIQPGRYQPRKYFDERALEELAGSIQSEGLLQPIAVRQFGERYEIVAGERRWRAAQKAGLQQVPVMVCQMTDESAQALGLIENIQRENLNPIEEAEAFYRLIEELGLTHDEVAERVGKSRSSITNFLRLLKLERGVQQAIIDKQLEMGHAKVLLALSKDQQLTAAHLIVQRGLSVRQTEVFVREMSHATNNDVLPYTTMSVKATKASRDFTALLGKKVKVNLKKDGSGKGHLQVSFNSLEELDRLYDELAAIN